jgi:hypothetical protein
MQHLHHKICWTRNECIKKVGFTNAAGTPSYILCPSNASSDSSASYLLENVLNLKLCEVLLCIILPRLIEHDTVSHHAYISRSQFSSGCMPHIFAVTHAL